MASKTAEPADLFDDGSVTVEGLKKEFGIGRSSAYELMNAGLLPFSRPYGRRLIPRAAVKKLLAEGMSTGVEK